MNRHTTLLLLPGLDGTDVFLRPLVASLPPSLRAIVVCYPDATFGEYEDLLTIVRETAAGIPEFYILGSSFSGPLAVMLAAAEPDKVRGIILAATFVRSPRPMLGRFRFAAVGPVVWVVRMTRRIPVWLLRRRQDPYRQAKAETWSRVSARCLAARVRAILGVDVRDALRRCRQPVLCVAFDADDVVPRRHAEEIVREARQARMVTLAGRHLAICLDPAPLAREIARFITEAESARR